MADAALRPRLTVRGRGTELAQVSVHLPDPGGLLLDPGAALADPAVSLKVTTAHLPTPVLSAFVPGLGETLDGLVPGAALALDLAAQGGAAGPNATVTARFRRTRQRGTGADSALAEALLLTANVTPEQSDARVLISQGGSDGFLDAHVQLDQGTRAILADPAQLSAAALQGRVKTTAFDLRGLTTFLPEVFGPSRGQLDIDLAVAGTLGMPAVTGHVAATFDEVVLAAAGFKERDLALHIDFTPETIRLRPLTLNDGSGRLELAFEVAVAGFVPDAMRLQSELTLDRYRPLRRRDLRAQLSGALTIDGTVAKPEVQGQLTVNEIFASPEMGGRSLHPIGTPDDVTFVSYGEVDAGTEAFQEREHASVALPALDVAVTIPDRAIHVNNDMLDLFVGGKLRVFTRGGLLAIDGRVGVVEGSVELYGRPFKVSDESLVIFTGSTELNPRLNVQATFDISDVDLSALGLTATPTSHIRIDITGSATEPRLELTSDPPMDEGNIISIMLVGAPLNSTAQEGDTGAVERQAVRLFVGLATGQVMKLLKDDLPIDVLKVDAGEAGLTDARITVGKRITRDLMLLYQANLDANPDENTNEVRLQYRLTNLLQLETHYGDAGRGGIDLLLRWRF